VQIKLTKSGPRRYVQIVKAYRDPDTGKPKQRHVASLGRLEELQQGGELENLIRGLQRVGGTAAEGEVERVATGAVERSVSIGATWAVGQVWKSLGLGHQARGGSKEIERALLLHVTRRLQGGAGRFEAWLACHDPWAGGAEDDLERAELFPDPVSVVQEAQTMVVALLAAGGEAVERVWCDLAPLTVERTAAVVRTDDARPLAHSLLSASPTPGLLAARLRDTTRTLGPSIRRMIVVCGPSSGFDEPAELDRLRIPPGSRLGYVLALPASSGDTIVPDLSILCAELCEQARDGNGIAWREIVGQQPRTVVVHSRQRARLERQHRARRVVKAMRVARRLARRLDQQDEGHLRPVWKLDDGTATARLGAEIAELDLGRWIRAELEEDAVFVWHWNVDKLKDDLQRDGSLILVSNADDLDTDDLVTQYFRGAELGSVFAAHGDHPALDQARPTDQPCLEEEALIRFLTLAIHRELEERIQKADIDSSPAEVLARLTAVQSHRVRMPDRSSQMRLSGLSDELQKLLTAIGIQCPNNVTIETDL
jgi:hypothetical protein